MLIVLYESPSNIILPFLDNLLKKYPSSSVANVTRKDKWVDLEAKYSKPPLFTAGWLLLCAPNVRVDNLTRLSAMNGNYVVVRVTSAATRDELIGNLKDVKFTLVDNYNLTETEVKEWISAELNCSNEITNAIYERTSGKLKAVIAAVQNLSVLDDITKTDIATYVRAVNFASVDDIVPYMLGIGKRKYKQVIDVIRQYQYATSWLTTFIIKQLDEYLELWTLHGLGELTDTNIEKLKEDGTLSSLKKVSVPKIRSRLKHFDEVSIEYLIYIRSQMASFNPKDRLTIFKIINLVKLGGKS